ncbi:unnamed protein product [Dicrocoelium dendriticum]|nr:unnamed protein product [Dicrocoelium dendriticum]
MVTLSKHGVGKLQPTQKQLKTSKLRLWHLFSYSDWKDKLSIICGIFFAAAGGTGFPLNVYIFRGIINNFVSPDFDAEMIYSQVKWFVILGAIIFIVTFAHSVLFGISSTRQSRRIRLLYFKVFINVIVGSIFLGNALPGLQCLLTAAASATDIFDTIQLVPRIDKDSPGALLPNFRGNIEFKNVNFVYPTRSDVTILNQFNLTLREGQTVALVGASGSGKSTIVHLLQRFYDPSDGHIYIEGKEIRELNLKAYRQQLGCVQQEPVLFEGTVADNIRMGKLDATQSEIEDAAKLANAHDFILALPQAYNTVLGERGIGMSGGQKQRIAIARALIRQPKLLLLDEATSALDTRSERVVQAALDQASAGRTTIVIAHRLTTVRNADLILVMDKGIIRESGTHDELLAMDGLYATMLRNMKESEALDEDEETAVVEEPTKEATINQQLLHDVAVNEKGEVDRLSQNTVSSSRLSNVSVRITRAVTSKYGKIAQSPVLRVLRMNRPEAVYISLGCVCSAIAGAANPAFALLYSEIFVIFTLVSEPDYMRARVSLVTGMMAFIGGCRFIGMLGQGFFFGVSGERLTRRLRCLLFHSMLKQEIGWFDQPENQPGALTSRLATEASKLKALSGAQLGFILESSVLIIMSLIIAFFYSWQLTLLMLVFLPLFILSGMLQVKRMSGEKDGGVDNKAMRIAQEAISTDRTVFTLTLEDHYYDRFRAALNDSMKTGLKRNLTYAVLYGLTQSVIMFCFAAAFSLGAYLVSIGQLQMVAVFRVFAVLNMGAQSLGRSASIGPELSRAVSIAGTVLATLDRIPQILPNVGKEPTTPFSGKIEFRQIYFKYPTRRGVRVLRNFSHEVFPGQTVALVGQSGCGKSTLLQLVQRFYDPSDYGLNSGVFFDGYNLRDLSPAWVRRQIGIVSQEPNLFDLSIKENIAYGDNSCEPSMERIVEAARLANIHDFICSLPQGYDTPAGQRGAKLSGGQKQRVAIARAMIRKPPLLLLDEATSALDNESERVVQRALDAAVGSRTSLVVAHRLNTVESADMVVVLENGRKIEFGPPQILLESKGAFYRLHHTEQAQDS